MVDVKSWTLTCQRLYSVPMKGLSSVRWPFEDISPWRQTNWSTLWQLDDFKLTWRTHYPRQDCEFQMLYFVLYSFFDVYLFLPLFSFFLFIFFWLFLIHLLFIYCFVSFFYSDITIILSIWLNVYICQIERIRVKWTSGQVW